MSDAKITATQVKHISSLANIPITKEEEVDLAKGFTQVLGVVDSLNKLNTENVEPTHHTTGLENVYREDEVDEDRMLSQDQALSNAKNTYQGYFVIEQILESK